MNRLKFYLLRTPIFSWAYEQGRRDLNDSVVIFFRLKAVEASHYPLPQERRDAIRDSFDTWADFFDGKSLQPKFKTTVALVRQ